MLGFKCSPTYAGFGVTANLIDLQFHISDIDEPDKSWEKLESVFGKHNEIRGHQLEKELISLNPNYFSCI